LPWAATQEAPLVVFVPRSLAASCFTQTDTPAARHCATIERSHSTLQGVRFGPLSAPPMTQ
jgi:hypothetical protein